MSRVQFNMTAEGGVPLLKAMTLVFECAGWSGVGKNGVPKGADSFNILKLDGCSPIMIFRWSKAESKTAQSFPFVMDAEGCAEFARRWLAQADYGLSPNVDGHCEKGWRVFNDGGGSIKGGHYAIVAVAPEWIIYGK